MSFRLFDGHCDTAYELWRRNEPLEENTCHLNLAGVQTFAAYVQVFAFCSYAGEEHPLAAQEELLTKPLTVLRHEVWKNRHRIAFAHDAETIRQTLAAGKMAAMLSVEGPEVISCDPERLKELHEQGFCMTTLTWNADNALAGCHLSDGGLTDQGRAFVKTAQELGIRIDVSHLGENAFWDLVDITTKPILASHSNCRAICDHSRNLTDEQLRAIAQTGGTVGLNLYPPFLGEGADFELLLRHLEHMLTVCGEEHVALGGDLDGCDVLADGFRSVADYPKFYEYLLACGYDAPLLEKVFFTNLLRLF